jgi:hypothetical protein
LRVQQTRQKAVVAFGRILLKNLMSKQSSAFTKAGISVHCYFSGFNRVQKSGFSGFLVDPAAFASCRRTYPVNWWRFLGQFGQPPQILYGGSQGG